MEAELPSFAEAAPGAPEDRAGLPWLEVLPPVAVGGASEYCTPLESA